ISCFVWPLTVGSQSAWGDAVKVARAANDKGRLPDLLLSAALERGGKHHPVYPYGDTETLPMSTRINGVKNGELDIFFALSTPEYEEQFIPVYIPIYRGMMGMRLAIVKNENSDIFKNIKNIEDLRQLKAGQGKFWADSNILEYNAIPLVRELKYKNLFRMLEADRFDYFPRGIQEPWSEVKQHEALNLTVDRHVMLWYRAPFYYFVPRSKPELAAHITEQLEAMIDDGSYSALFDREPYIQAALQEANIEQRTIIRIKNPFLTAKTPIDREELWYSPSRMSQYRKQENTLTQTPLAVEKPL
ncbi:MAG TPA: transporter substrate-binding domain-containing protein, partial [Marinagarivorans sp.]